MNRVDYPNYYVCVLYEIIRYDLILVRIARYAHKAKLPKSIYTLLIARQYITQGYNFKISYKR